MKKLKVLKLLMFLTAGCSFAAEEEGAAVPPPSGYATHLLRNIERLNEMTQIDTNFRMYVTPLYSTISSYRVGDVKALLDAGADVNAQVRQRQTMTPLIYACRLVEKEFNDDREFFIRHPWSKSIIRICKMLIDAGADIELTDENNETALDIAHRLDWQDLSNAIESPMPPKSATKTQ